MSGCGWACWKRETCSFPSQLVQKFNTRCQLLVRGLHLVLFEWISDSSSTSFVGHKIYCHDRWIPFFWDWLTELRHGCHVMWVTTAVVTQPHPFPPLSYWLCTYAICINELWLLYEGFVEDSTECRSIHTGDFGPRGPLVLLWMTRVSLIPTVIRVPGIRVWHHILKNLHWSVLRVRVGSSS